jgi:hypothetical protein
MKRVYQANDLPQAYLLKHLLEEAGIPVTIFNENAQGGVGELPFTHTYPEIWVTRDSDRHRARELLLELEKQGNEIGADKDCPVCGERNPGNFETCWQCGGALP